MANRWEVHEYCKEKIFSGTKSGTSYGYHLRYGGESLFKAIYVVWKLKNKGANCIELKWRP